MEINGLPAHPLIVHAVVVILPLAALVAIAASLWRPLQRKLTWVIPLLAVVGTAAVPVAVKAGESLAATMGNPAFIENHQRLGTMILPWAIALVVLTAGQWLHLRREDPTGGLTVVLSALVIVAALGTTVLVVLTGDAGAQAVWAERFG